MQNCLVIGNGLNQCLPDGVSWGNLLEMVAEEYHIEYNPDLPMPLEFERIVNEILKSRATPFGDIYDEVKGKIIEKIKDYILPSEAVHYRIKDLGIDAIITTNYDSLLEQVFDPTPTSESKPKANKYLEIPTSTVNGIKFYHAHGFYLKKGTICLGYEHYAGILQRLRDDFNSDTKEAKRKKIRQILDKTLDKTGKWGELFYTANIAIIGFGLWESEIDFWWLITHRAYLYYTNYEGIQEDMKNKVVYYDIVDDILRKDNAEEEIRISKYKQQQSKHSLLQGLHVEVKTYLLSECESYEQAYHRIFDDLGGDKQWTKKEAAAHV